MSFYAVAKGRKTGIFSSWPECESQILKFSGAKYKKFKTKNEAEEYLKTNGVKNSHESNNYPLVKKTNLCDVQKLKYHTTPINLLREKESSSNRNEDNSNNKKDCMKKVQENNFDSEDDDLLANATKEVEKNLLHMPSSSVARKRKYNELNSTKLVKYESNVFEVAGYKKFGNYEFPIDSTGFVIVYTDGSCENNGKPNAAAGLGVYFDDDHPLNISKPVDGRATNNCGEIQAALYALNVAKENEIDKIIINTDSQFLIDSALKWIWSWKNNKWKLKSGGQVKNIYEFQRLYPFLIDKDIQIKWNYTKGHNGIKGNVQADLLARKGAESYRILHQKEKNYNE